MVTPLVCGRVFGRPRAPPVAVPSAGQAGSVALPLARGHHGEVSTCRQKSPEQLGGAGAVCRGGRRWVGAAIVGSQRCVAPARTARAPCPGSCRSLGAASAAGEKASAHRHRGVGQAVAGEASRTVTALLLMAGAGTLRGEGHPGPARRVASRRRAWDPLLCVPSVCRT